MSSSLLSQTLQSLSANLNQLQSLKHKIYTEKNSLTKQNIFKSMKKLISEIEDQVNNVCKI